MALRRTLYAAPLLSAFALAACQESEPPTGAIEEEDSGSSAYESSDPGTGADMSDDGYAGGEAQDNPASDSAGQDLTGETARGGDALSVGGDTERGPAVEEIARRFDLSDADTIILPTLYRAAADITSNQLELDTSREEEGYVTISGSADPDAVLRQPRDGVAFELTEDRVTEFLGQPVIVTLVARMGDDWEPNGARPALRAAWVEPNGDSSGWRTMGLTEDWQKAVFAYDQPTDTGGIHVLTLLPPDDQPVDVAAVAIRAQGGSEAVHDGGEGEMQVQETPQLGASPRGSDMQEPREPRPDVGEDDGDDIEDGGR